MSPPECLFGRFQLDFGVLAEDVIAETFVGKKLEYTTLWVLAESGGFISLGTSHKLNSFNCRSPI